MEEEKPVLDGGRRGRTERDGLFPMMLTHLPPPSIPIIAGLLNVELHPRKSSIDSSSLAGFHPKPLVLALPYHHLVMTAGCCISS